MQAAAGDDTVAAPIKRMSILERRSGDGRDVFLRHWRHVHGPMVSAMPHLYAYVQNHVVEAFDCGSDAFPADGFVEQLWRSARDMQRGYASPAVNLMLADEPNYLGHGSNYVLLASGGLRTVPDARKLICSVRHGGDPAVADAVYAVICASARDAILVREDVIATIAKPNMLPVPPRVVDMFVQIVCGGEAAAGATGRAIAGRIAAMALGRNGGAGLHRVSTVTITAAKA